MRQGAWNKSMKGEYDASITVEAAFVMPVVLLTVFALICLTLQLHDICRIQGVVDRTLHQAGISYKHQTDIASGEIDYEKIRDEGVILDLQGDPSIGEEKLLIYLSRELQKGLFLLRIAEIEADADRKKVCIKAEAKAPISLPWVSSLFARSSDTVIAGDYPVHDPAETLRLCEVILDTGSQVKGVDQLKSRLETFLKGGRK